MFKIIWIVLLVFFIISLLGACSKSPLDNTKPEITVIGVEDGAVYNTGITPQISANEEVTWDITLTKNGNIINYSRGDTISDVGEYILIIKATDNAGNEQTLASISFKISDDNTAPNVNITSPIDGSLLGENPVTVQWTINDESPYTWELYIGGATNPEITGNQNSTHSYTFDPVELFENYYGGVRIRVEATDEVGNNNDNYVDVIIDTRPDIVFGDNGSGNYWWDVNDGNLIIYVANNGPSTAGESRVKVNFNNGQKIDYIQVPSIESGANIELPGVDMPSIGGGANIYFDVILDVDNDVKESNENNNEDSDFLVT